MSATPEELHAVSMGLANRHGVDVMALIALADFVGNATDWIDPPTYNVRMAEMGRCVRARLRELGKTDEQYVAAAQDFYRARQTMHELAALPD